MAKAKWPTFTPSGGLGKTAVEALAAKLDPAKVVKIITDDEAPSFFFNSPSKKYGMSLPEGLHAQIAAVHEEIAAKMAEKLAEDVDKAMVNGLVGKSPGWFHQVGLKLHLGVGESMKIQFTPPPNFSAKAEDALDLQQNVVTVSQWQYLFCVSASVVNASQVGLSISKALGDVYSGAGLLGEALVLLQGHPETTEILCDESDYRDMAAAAINQVMKSVDLQWDYEKDWKTLEYTVSVRLRVENRPVRIIPQD